jgi:acetyl esterase/lipase
MALLRPRAIAVCAIGLLTLGFAVAGETFYHLRLDLTTASLAAEVGYNSGLMLVDRFPLGTKGTEHVSTCPVLRVSKPGCYPLLVSFDVFITIPDEDPLRWTIAKDAAGTVTLEVYGFPQSGGDPILLAKWSHRGNDELAQSSKRFSLARDKLLEVCAPVTLTMDQEAATYRGCETFLDLPYATLPGVDPTYTSLDLYLPPRDTESPPPLVVWLHGGGWETGDKYQPHAAMNFGGTLGDAYAVACVNYRLSGVAPFPAQIHDCKAAIRWLRAHAAEYGYDPNHIGVWGLSAGGHLGALLGVSNGVQELEGTVGDYIAWSSAVQAVCDFSGPADLMTLAEQASPGSREGIEQYVSHLLGGPLEENADMAALGSPIYSVSADDAPFFIVQGDDDELVSVLQSTALHDALVAAGVSSTLCVVAGEGHPPDYSPERGAAVRAFFDLYLAGAAEP